MTIVVRDVWLRQPRVRERLLGRVNGELPAASHLSEAPTRHVRFRERFP